MAILGKDNIIEIVRMQKAPYWRIAETVQARQAGNYVATADFENPELGIEDSLDKLRATLNRLTPGRYLLVSFLKNDAKRGGVDSWIEVESGKNHLGDPSIGSTGTPAFYMEGIGQVTPENFESAIETKMKKIREKELEEERIKKLEAENKELKASQKEYETGINKGLYSVGSLIWNQMRNTPAGKEVAGMIGQTMKSISAAAPKQAAVSAGTSTEESISGSTDPQDRIAAALSSMLGDDQEDIAKQKELAEQLELLARVKKENPDLLKQGLDFIENM